MYSKSRMMREYRREIEAVETEFMPKGGFPEGYIPIVPNDEKIKTLEEYLVAECWFGPTIALRLRENCSD